MANLEEQLRSGEKTIADDNVEESANLESVEILDLFDKQPTTLESEQRCFHLQDKPFRDTYNTLYSDLCHAIESGNQDDYYKLISDAKQNKINQHLDHLQRSLLHVAVDMENFQYVKFLVRAGCFVNGKEGCGLTPLNLAVMKKNRDISEFLVSSGAQYAGPLFTSVPSPNEMAQILDTSDIQKIFDHDKVLSEEEDSLICTFDQTYQHTVSSRNLEGNEDQVLNRQTEGFITPVVGDVGTCKINCLAMARSSSFNWEGIIPGDLHNKGYYCEAILKAHGTSGLHYIITNVMNRKKLTSEAFKDRKFNDDNLIKIHEAVRDVSRSYGIAAALEFRRSGYFPTPRDLSAALQESKSHNIALLPRFKEWIKKCSEKDASFNHHSSLLLLYGPLLELYDDVTAYRDGYGREIVYQLQTPLYAQLSFPNYYTECFRHVVNFLAKWPELTHNLLRENCKPVWKIWTWNRDGCLCEV